MLYNSYKRSNIIGYNHVIYVICKCIKGLPHYQGDKQEFDVSSEGPSSGICTVVYPLPTLATVYTRFQNYATLRENRLRSNVSFMSYLLLKIANINKRDFILYLSKETNIKANEGRFTNENKLQTFSSETYIMNHFQTRKKNNLVDLNYI